MAESPRTGLPSLLQAMGNLSFLRGEDEVREPGRLKKGDNPVTAAGKIHADWPEASCRRCFKYDDLISHGPEKL